MPLIKSSLVKPYFYVDFDENTRFRIDAKSSDINRFIKHYKEWSEKIQKLSNNGSDAQVCRECLEFLCGDKVGNEIYDLCVADLKSDDPDLTDEDCVFSLIPVLTMIAELWIDYAASMDFEHSERARSYLKKIKTPNAL